MGRLVVFTSITLDGVMQAPGRPDEDVRDSFAHGGWGVPYADAVTGGFAGGSDGSGGLLLGRRTYLDFYDVWPNRPANPFTDALNAARKYVASTTLEEPLPWRNSILLKGDVGQRVAELKAEPDGNLLVLGSGELVQSLMRVGLVDEYLLLIHPLVLGEGRRLFRDGGPPATLTLVNSVTSPTGVLCATYRPQA